MTINMNEIEVRVQKSICQRIVHMSCVCDEKTPIQTTEETRGWALLTEQQEIAMFIFNRNQCPKCVCYFVVRFDWRHHVIEFHCYHKVMRSPMGVVPKENFHGSFSKTLSQDLVTTALSRGSLIFGLPSCWFAIVLFRSRSCCSFLADWHTSDCSASGLWLPFSCPQYHHSLHCSFPLRFSSFDVEEVRGHPEIHQPGEKDISCCICCESYLDICADFSTSRRSKNQKISFRNILCWVMTAGLMSLSRLKPDREIKTAWVCFRISIPTSCKQIGKCLLSSQNPISHEHLAFSICRFKRDCFDQPKKDTFSVEVYLSWCHQHWTTLGCSSFEGGSLPESLTRFWSVAWAASGGEVGAGLGSRTWDHHHNCNCQVAKLNDSSFWCTLRPFLFTADTTQYTMLL